MHYRIKTIRRSIFSNLVKYFFVVVLLVAFIAPQLMGTDYYIATTGDDRNNGSIDSPWLSLQHAIEVAGAGDTILMRGGTYDTHEVWIRGDRGMGGANGKYLTIKNYPGETVSVGGSRRIIIRNVSYLRIEGLNFRLPYNIAGGGVGIQIVNNRFIGFQADYGAITTGGDGILVEGNHIEITEGGGGSTQDHGIYLLYAKNVVIRNNFISGASGYNIHIYDENKGSGEKKRYENIRVENNFLTNSRSRCGILIGAHDPTVEMDGIIVRNNVITNNAGPGILIKYQPISNISILHNVLYGNWNGIYIEAEIDNLIIRNNIFSVNKQNHIDIYVKIPNATISHNLYFQPKSVGSGVIDSQPLYGDPLFVNAAGGDFHLKKGSPAIDAGIVVGPPYNGSAPDIGAFEYNLK